MQEEQRIKSLESVLAILTGLIVFGFILDLAVLHKIALIVSVLSLFFKAFTKYLSIGWMKLAEGLGFITSKILLSSVFFLFLNPIAFLYKLSSNNKMTKKPESDSVFTNRDHLYSKEDFDKTW